MIRRAAAVLALCVLAGSGVPAAPDATDSKKPVLKERVNVSLVQLEVTVWPDDPESDACLGLTAGDFELTVDGKPHPIYAVDAVSGEEDALDQPQKAASAGETTLTGLNLVLLLDLWHLNVFHEFFDCPDTKMLAFREARRVIDEQFHEGDRLLLVTFDGWPTVHYGWIRTAPEAMAALDRLSKNRQVVAPRQEHVHHEKWIAGMESLFLALGRYPGRKDVIYLGDDFRFDDVASRMYDIAARAQSNGVVVSAVDLLDSCRKMPGPGPHPSCPPTGGLACTPFSSPVALNPFSRDTGGELFRTERIASAVRALRTMRKCRYVVSFRQESRKRTSSPVVKLALRGDRKGISLRAPSSFQPLEKAPTAQERDEALFLLPRFGRGLAVEATLWPYHPSSKKGRWKAFVLARVERTDDEPWPEELSELTVSVIPHARSVIYGQFQKRIAGKDLADFRARGGTRLMLYPVDGIRPGDATVEVTVLGDAEQISATTRKSILVPELPEPGEARSWFLSDHVVRFGDAEVLAPSLDDVVSAGQPIAFMGYGCRSKGGGASPNDASSLYEGRLKALAGGAEVPVPIRWLESPQPAGGACGWLVGRIAAPDRGGIWSYEPPRELAGRKGAEPVEFSVVSRTSPAGPPAEVAPIPGATPGRPE